MSIYHWLLKGNKILKRNHKFVYHGDIEVDEEVMVMRIAAQELVKRGTGYFKNVSSDIKRKVPGHCQY